jgi:hypothetical protein
VFGGALALFGSAAGGGQGGGFFHGDAGGWCRARLVDAEINRGVGEGNLDAQFVEPHLHAAVELAAHGPLLDRGGFDARLDDDG